MENQDSFDWSQGVHSTKAPLQIYSSLAYAAPGIINKLFKAVHFTAQYVQLYYGHKYI